eukprot:403367030
MDVGSHLGYYSLVMAQQGFRSIAFEPLLDNTYALRSSLCINADNSTLEFQDEDLDLSDQLNYEPIFKTKRDIKREKFEQFNTQKQRFQEKQKDLNQEQMEVDHEYINMKQNLDEFKLQFQQEEKNIGIKIDQAIHQYFEEEQHLKYQENWWDRVEIYDYGLGLEQQTCDIFNFPYKELDAIVKCDLKGQYIENANKIGEIEVLSLDDFIDEFPSNYKISVMKLNANGMELQIIRGGLKFLKKYQIPNIVITVDSQMLSYQGYSPDQIYTTLTELGYNFHKDSFQG